MLKVNEYGWYGLFNDGFCGGYPCNQGEGCTGVSCFECDVHLGPCTLMAQFSHCISSCDTFISASISEVIWSSLSQNEISKNKCKCPRGYYVAVLGMTDVKIIQNMPVNLLDYLWNATPTFKTSFLRYLPMRSSLRNMDQGCWFPSIPCTERGAAPWRILCY